MTYKTLIVEGMSCDHCVQTINKIVGDLFGVSKIKVDLDNKLVGVEFDNTQIKIEKIIEKIVEAGFEVC